MKAFFSAAFLATTIALCPAAEQRFATLDLQRALAGYHKAQEAEQSLQQKKVSFLKELETLRLEGRKIVDEAEALRTLSLEPILTATAREEKKREFDGKLADLREFEIRYERANAERASELQVHAERLNKRVIEDVLIAMRVVGEKEGFNFILNANRLHPASGEVLFSRNVTDVTDKVLASLNATKPAPAARP